MAFAATALCAFAIVERFRSPAPAGVKRPFELLDAQVAPHASGEGELPPAHSNGGAY
jgi:hypothetical protein